MEAEIINKFDGLVIAKNAEELVIVENAKTSFSEIITKCKYIQDCKSNVEREITSLSYLVDFELSQSSCIKLGIGVEKVLFDFILANSNLKSIKEKTKKDVREKDHLFIDNLNKIVYYAEIKSNTNLDTEKSKETINKCLCIEAELKTKYPEYSVKMFIVAVRYYSKTQMPSFILKKYSSINNNLVGVNEYFDALSVEEKFTEDVYKKLINEIASAMFLNKK